MIVPIKSYGFHWPKIYSRSLYFTQNAYRFTAACFNGCAQKTVYVAQSSNPNVKTILLKYRSFTDGLLYHRCAILSHPQGRLLSLGSSWLSDCPTVILPFVCLTKEFLYSGHTKSGHLPKSLFVNERITCVSLKLGHTFHVHTHKNQY